MMIGGMGIRMHPAVPSTSLLKSVATLSPECGTYGMEEGPCCSMI